jgi:uncharacterized LabA/DUF88 family protein
VGKNVAVFVDVANIFYAAKAAGVDIDYVLLLKAATAGRDLVRAYAYTGLDPDNENQRNFHSFLARNGFRVVSKDIRKYGDGKVKANLDIELVVDLMKTSRNLDVAVVVSGDGDFAPAIRAVQETGVRVEVISFRGNTSADLIEVADRFTDITQLAKVEKASTASGRRAAARDEDLSMTEVPDKESEGSLRGRGRGRVRERTRAVEAPPAEEGRAASRTLAIVALPGEKLSKAAAASVAAAAAGEAEVVVSADGAARVSGEVGVEGDGEEHRRRRRRRGGRGRGRGRGHDVAAPEGAPVVEELLEDDEGDEAAHPARPVARPAAFGSVWDSQIGVPSAPRASGVADAEDFDDEPAIPEYLLAERRRGGRGVAQPQRGRPRSRSGAYAAAVERERFGGRGGSRPAEPIHRGARGERSPRLAPTAPGRDRGPERRSHAEPWSEVPPELEELLRAQLAQKEARRETAAPAAPSKEAAPAAPAAEEAAPRRRTRRPAAPAAVTAQSAAPAAAPAAPSKEAPPAAPAAEEAAPRRRTRRPATPAAATAETAAPAAEEAAPAAPRRRTRRPATPAAATAQTAAPAGEGGSAAGDG